MLEVKGQVLQLGKSKYKPVTPEMIKESTDNLEFYDKHGHFPYDSKLRIWLNKNKDLGFWLALATGIIAVGILIYWIIISV